jgi:serine/threonine-protein kinase SRPK3
VSTDSRTHGLIDISAGNILLGIEDKDVLTSFIKAEHEHPSPRKEVDGYTVYISRRFDSPRGIGEPVLSDFGSAVSGEVENDRDVQPNVYRCPEVCLQMPWSYNIDIWNVGVLVR